MKSPFNLVRRFIDRIHTSLGTPDASHVQGVDHQANRQGAWSPDFEPWDCPSWNDKGQDPDALGWIAFVPLLAIAVVALIVYGFRFSPVPPGTAFVVLHAAVGCVLMIVSALFALYQRMLHGSHFFGAVAAGYGGAAILLVLHGVAWCSENNRIASLADSFLLTSFTWFALAAIAATVDWANAPHRRGVMLIWSAVGATSALPLLVTISWNGFDLSAGAALRFRLEPWAVVVHVAAMACLLHRRPVHLLAALGVVATLAANSTVLALLAYGPPENTVGWYGARALHLLALVVLPATVLMPALPDRIHRMGRDEPDCREAAAPVTARSADCRTERV